MKNYEMLVKIKMMEEYYKKKRILLGDFSFLDFLCNDLKERMKRNLRMKN